MPDFVHTGAVVGSIVLSVVLGFIWYGPLFGKQWMKLSGITMPNKKPSMSVMTRPMILSFIGAFCMAFTLSSVIYFHDAIYGTSGYESALSVAVLMWLGFIVPAYLNLTGWENKPWTLFFINTGYWLVFLLLSAAMIVAL